MVPSPSETRSISYLYFLHFLLFTSSHPLSSALHQSASQTLALFRLRRILEYPASLSSWNRYTSFCSISSSPSLSISCSAAGQITELSINGGGIGKLVSSNFSSDSLFTTLCRFKSLTTLSLVSLGIWGPLPSKIKRLSSLKALNLSSNYFSGAIPPEIVRLPSLQSLALSQNNFNGTVPDLKSMSLLSDLDLSANSLGPEFPSLTKSISTLNLQNNSFSSKIPIRLASLNRLQKLDLSSNLLRGPIPSFLFSLPSVRSLDLSSNNFTGSFPPNLSCSDELNFIDISRNFLIGTLPLCIRANSSNLIVLNSWNCLSMAESSHQHPKSYCIAKPLAATFPVPNKKEGPKNKLGLKLVIVGGTIGGGVLLGFLLFLVFGKIKSEGNEVVNFLHKPINRERKFHPKTPADTRGHMSQAVIIGTLGLTPYRVFTIEELAEATDGFNPSNLVSEGLQGQFYKGWLPDGSVILVRSLRIKQKNSSHSLLQYMEVISKLRHRHLVSILGHCIITSRDSTKAANILFLVFEYVSNGTLRSHLTEWRKREMLKWSQRINAVIGIARGLQFLHTFTIPGIVGNHLSMDNILLDETLTAKISNYRLPWLPKDKNNMAGCESLFDVGEESGIVSVQNLENAEKEDIYQLGLILLEVITGKPAASQGGLDALRFQLQGVMNESPVKLQAHADPTIRKTYAFDSLRTAAELALNCVAPDRSQRPSIDDVLWNLHYCLQIQDGRGASSEHVSTQ